MMETDAWKEPVQATSTDPPLLASTASTLVATSPPVADDDSDPDFDDLDDVLDQFSTQTPAPVPIPAPKQPSQPTPFASGPGRPKDVAQSPPPALGADESEEEFMAKLTSEMSSVFQKFNADPQSSQANAEELTHMGKELDDFTEAMDKQGVKPEDLLRAVLGKDAGEKAVDAAKAERDRSHALPAGKATFEDTIRKTMERIEKSDTSAKTAATKSSNTEEDMLAELLRAMESEGGMKGDDGGLSLMFLAMMEQLTNKDMLYEPMKELNEKFPEWLQKNKQKLSPEDLKRFTTQRRVVGEIVAKYEESGYSDEDSKCREYLWKRMQKMQAEGSPPEDLIVNPFPGMSGLPGVGGGGEEGGGEEAACPTQ